MKYWVERWSELRMKEMIQYPGDFVIHNDYLKMLPEEDIRNGFGELFDVLYQIYKAASLYAEKMLLPAHDMNEYRYLSKEERLSRGASYKYAKFLYALGSVGELAQNNELHINPVKFKMLCKELGITGINGCLEVLTNYGFVLDGLVNGIDVVADLLSEQEREVALLIHKELMKRKYFFNFQEWNEGPQIRYFIKETDCKKNTNASFWLVSLETSIRFYFRLKHMEGALTQIENASENVKQNFLVSDNGCENRYVGRCVSGISYELCGNTIWRCGCCNPNFQVVPRKDDYMFYIDLVDSIGRKK